MPILPSEREGVGPSVPHFALLMSDDGTRVAIPPGASLWLVEDQSRADRIFPLTLKSVSHKKIVFTMLDDKGGLTEYSYQLVGAKPLNRAALERLRKNNPNALVK